MRFEAPADRRSKGCQHRRHTPLIRPPLGCTAAAAEGAKEAAKVLGTARRLTPLMTSDGLPHCMQVLGTAPTLKPLIASDRLPHCTQVLDTALAHTELVLVSGNTADAAADADAAGGVPVRAWKAKLLDAGKCSPRRPHPTTGARLEGGSGRGRRRQERRRRLESRASDGSGGIQGRGRRPRSLRGRNGRD